MELKINFTKLQIYGIIRLRHIVFNLSCRNIFYGSRNKSTQCIYLEKQIKGFVCNLNLFQKTGNYQKINTFIFRINFKKGKVAKIYLKVKIISSTERIKF